MKISLQNSRVEEYWSLCSHRQKKKKSMLKQNLLCHDFSIASRSFWVMIISSACGSQSLLTKSFYRDEMKSRCFCSMFLQNWSVKNVKYRLKWSLQASSWKPWLCSLSCVIDSHPLPHLQSSPFFPTSLNQGSTYIPDQLTHNNLLWNSLSAATDSQFLFLFVSCAFLFIFFYQWNSSYVLFNAKNTVFVCLSLLLVWFLNFSTNYQPSSKCSGCKKHLVIISIYSQWILATSSCRVSRVVVCPQPYSAQ